jgi:hypothetical protein
MELRNSTGPGRQSHVTFVHYQAPGSLEQYVQEIGRAARRVRPARCILLFDAADLDLQERLQALSRPTVWLLARLETALTASATEHRAPTAAALAYSAGVPVRIGEVLLSDLEQAGLVERDQEGRIVVAPPEIFQSGARAISWQSSRRFVTRASAGSGPSPIMHCRRNAGACSSGGTSGKSSHHAARPVTAAAPSLQRLLAPAHCGDLFWNTEAHP